MKKFSILIFASVTAIFLANAQAQACWPWSKVDEQVKAGGEVVCTWKCGTYPNFGYTTTSGKGKCPEPSE